MLRCTIFLSTQSGTTAHERAKEMFALDTTPFDLSKMAEMFDTADFSKMFEMPEMDAMSGNALFDGQRKNVEAMIKAQQVASAGYQSMFEKQVSMMQDVFSGLQGQIADMSKAPSATDAATQQVAMVKKSCEDAMANLNELAEIAQKANNDAFTVIKDRVEASFKELKAA